LVESEKKSWDEMQNDFKRHALVTFEEKKMVFLSKTKKRNDI